MTSLEKYTSQLPNYYIPCRLAEPILPKKTRIDLSRNSNHEIIKWESALAGTNGTHLKVLRKLIKKVQYIDFPKFLTGLGYSIKAAADQIDFSNRHTAIGIVPGKSNEWVTALAFKCCKALSRFPCFNIAHNGRGTLMQSMGASISQKKFNDLPSQFIVIDDGSYSGLQLFNHVTSIVDTIQHKAKEGTKIILIVPYMTNAALQRLKAIEMPANISLVIADHVPIQTIKESMEVEDYDLLRDMFPEQITEDDSGITLTCFQHKVPNGQSFFAPVAQLLSDIETPYKGKDDSKTEDGK